MAIDFIPEIDFIPDEDQSAGRGSPLQSMRPILPQTPLETIGNIGRGLWNVADKLGILDNLARAGNGYTHSGMPTAAPELAAPVLNALSVDPQQYQNAMDLLRNPLNPAAQSNPPGVEAQAMSGIINKLNQTSGAVATDPLAQIALMTGSGIGRAALGEAAPLVNRGMTGLFAGQSAVNAPEVARQAGTVLGSDAPISEKAAALVDIPVTAAMIGGLGASALRGAGLDIRRATERLTPQEAYIEMTPEQRAIADQGAIDALNPRKAQDVVTSRVPSALDLTTQRAVWNAAEMLAQREGLQPAQETFGRAAMAPATPSRFPLPEVVRAKLEAARIADQQSAMEAQNATQERQVQEGVQRQREGTDAQRIPAEPGASDSLRAPAPVEQKAQETLTQPGLAEPEPVKSHAEEMATSLAIPLWIPHESQIYKKLSLLRESKDSLKSSDITKEWKSFTPAQRQELLSYGWRTGDTRKPGQVTIHASQDAFSEKLRQAVMAKQTKPVEPTTVEAKPISKRQGIERPWDIIDEIKSIGKIRNQKNAKPGSEGYYDESYKNAASKSAARGVFDKNGMGPDQMADELRRRGVLGQDATVQDMNDLIASHADQRTAIFKGETPEIKQSKFWKLLDEQAKKKSAQIISVGDLEVGAKFKIKGEQFVVKNIDPDTGEVTVDDGRKFGTQDIPDGADIPADSGTVKRPKASAQFVPKEQLAAPETKPVGPKLGPGQNQGDLIDSTQSEPLRLVQESTVDNARIEAEKQAAAKAAEEAKALQEKQQLGFVGMGGAVPSEFKPSGQTQTGLKNAAIDAQRQERGEAPLLAPARLSNQAAFDEAMARIDRDPGWQDRLIEELKQKTRVLNPVEHMAMVQREADLRNEFAKATRDGAQAYDDGRLADVKDAELRTQIFSDKMSELEKLMGKGGVGTEAGRALQIRQRMLNDDFTLANLELQVRRDRGFAPITPEERAQLKQLADDHKRLTEQLAQTEQKAIELEAEKAIAQARLEQAQKQAVPPHLKAIIDRAINAIHKGGEDSRKYFAGKSLSLSPEDLYHLSRIAADNLVTIAEVGAKRFEAWSTKMRSEFGDKIEPHLKNLYAKADELIESTFAKTAGPAMAPKVKKIRTSADPADMIEKAKASIATKIDKGEGDDIFTEAQLIVKALVTENPKIAREALNEQVQSILAEFYPGISRYETLEAISGLGRFRMPSMDEIKVKIADLKTQDRFLAQQMLVKAGEPIPRTGFQPRKLTDDARREAQILEEFKKQYGVVVTDESKQLGSNLTARKTYLTHRIADLQKEIQTKERLARVQPRQETDAELDALREKYRNVQAEHDAIFAYEKSVEKRRNGIAKRIQYLQEKIARNDFTLKKKTEPVKNAEIIALLADKQKLEDQFKHGRELERLANRSKFEKAVDTTKEYINASRNVLSSWDVSAVGRQGGFIGAGRPSLAAKSIGPMFSALANADAARRIEQRIFQRENYKNGTYKEAGLYIAPHDSLALSAQEEMIQNHIGNRIPGVKQSNRAFITYLNLLRTDAFDAIAASVEKGRWFRRAGSLTPEEAKVIANYVNVATGRGNIGNAAGAAQTLANVFFSPRLMASRFQLILGQPLWTQPFKASGRVRLAIAEEYARSLTGLAALIGLGALAGAQVETDPRSSDFLKLKFGNTRVDLLGGLIQNTVLMARLVGGKTKTAKGEVLDLYGSNAKPFNRDESDVIMQFLRTKLAPVPGGVWTAWTGENVVGEKMTPGQTALGLVTPLSFRDILDVAKEHGLAGGGFFTMLSLLGAGLQYYQPKPAKVNPLYQR